MCLITFIPKGIEIPKDSLEGGACSNPDGHGWAVASAEHGLVMGKSMDADKAIDEFIKERERQGDGVVALFHSRFATHGTKNLANVHPFYVPDVRGGGNQANTVIAHNGVMPGIWHPGKDDDRSDTRVFADMTAAWYLTERGVPSRRGSRALGDMIGKGNKLVFISTRMPGEPHVRIVNASSGTWHEGVWFSNEWFRRKRYTPTTGSYSTTAMTCAKEGCKNTFYLKGETLCMHHRPSQATTSKATAPKRGGVKKSTPSKPVTTGTKPGYVSPYKALTPPEEIDEEIQGLLDEIEVTLSEVTDCYPDRVCEVCRTKGTVHLTTSVCVNCRTCLDCWESVEHCECFNWAGYLARLKAETDELAEALAREAEWDAQAEKAKAEAAEEKYLAAQGEKVPSPKPKTKGRR